MMNCERTGISRLAMVLLYVLFPLMILELGHWSIYELAPNSAIYLAIFSTDFSETIEFLLSHNLHSFYLRLLGILFISLVLYKLPLRRSSKPLMILSFLLLPSIFFSQILVNQTFLRMIPNYLVYSKERANFEKRLSSFKKMDFKVRKLDENERTVIFILGESTTKNRLSLYGYTRPTTPNLESISNLLVFKNIQSPHTQTFQSLKKVLTLMNSANEESLRQNAHILDLAKAAGYQTYWISNQKPMGWFENAHSAIANQADEKYWLNSGIGMGSTPPHDEVILPAVDRALSKKGKPKFIVIHLMGTHAHYKNRYPESFGRFKGKLEGQLLSLSEEEQEKYNHYDNAILYQDYVLTQIHKKLTGDFTLIYFPDHGEEVFQSTRYAGHSVLKKTANMLEIPLLLVTSDDELRERASISLNRAWNTENFIHTLHSLLKVDSSIYDKSLDLLQSNSLMTRRN